MLHEFFEVNSLIAINVCSKSQSYDFLLRKFDFSILETLNVFVDFQETVLVTIILFKEIKQI